MNTMRCVVLLLVNIVVVMRNLNVFAGAGESNICTDREHLPLCFCRASHRRSSLTDLFLANLSLFQCDVSSLPIQHCRRSQFHTPSFRLTELIPQVTNLSHCLKDIHCLHVLHSIQYCRKCQLTRTDASDIDTCFNFCEQNPSCGIVCLNQPVIISINCNRCRGRRQNVSCRCINSSPSCLPLIYDTTTPRWMQKSGFPAAAIFALLILAAALAVITIKLIYRQLDIIDRRHSIANQTHQLPPSYLNTQRFVMEIHRCDEENELNILLLEKTSKL